jgi:hypothetical protein
LELGVAAGCAPALAGFGSTLIKGGRSRTAGPAFGSATLGAPALAGFESSPGKGGRPAFTVSGSALESGCALALAGFESAPVKGGGSGIAVSGLGLATICAPEPAGIPSTFAAGSAAAPAGLALLSATGTGGRAVLVDFSIVESAASSAGFDVDFGLSFADASNAGESFTGKFDTAAIAGSVPVLAGCVRDDTVVAGGPLGAGEDAPVADPGFIPVCKALAGGCWPPAA